MDVKHALTVLNRLASRRPGEARRLEGAFRGRLEQLAETALEVAVETGDPAGAELPKRVAEQAVLTVAIDCPYSRSRPLAAPTPNAPARLRTRTLRCR